MPRPPLVIGGPGFKQMWPPPAHQFLDNEAQRDPFSSDDENKENEKSETQSDKDFIDDNASVDSASFFRVIDNWEEEVKKPLNKGRKIACKYCQRQMRFDNYSRHLKKLKCVELYEFCTDCYKQKIHPYYLKADKEKHIRDHRLITCDNCKAKIDPNDTEHINACKNEEEKRDDIIKLVQKLEERYTSYMNYITENNLNPKHKNLYQFAKNHPKTVTGITDEQFKYLKDKYEPPLFKTPAPPKDTGKKRKGTPSGDPDKVAVKKCKSPEDDEGESSLKPSQNFEVTLQLKGFKWIYITILKYIMSTFFDGYYIPSRFAKTWPLDSRSTPLFPRPCFWGTLQQQALQKTTPLRRSLRARARKNSSRLGRDYINLKYFIYTINRKNYFRKRFIKPIKWIKEFIAAKEHGLDAPLHCHMYIKTEKKMYINTLRRFFNRFKYNGVSILGNIATVRNVNKWVKYITKEDHNAVVRNRDKEACHNNYIMWNFAKLSQCCNMSQYAMYRWPTMGLMNKYRMIHSAYWEPILKSNAYIRAMEALDPVEKDDIEMIANFCLTFKKKGIYLWGDPKTGKSTTALCMTKGTHFQVPEGTATFAFHSWQDEPFILFEDVSDVEFLHFRNKINQLCDEHGLCFAQTKGGGSRLIRCKKVIVTSNYPPPSEEKWPGFERRFLCINYSQQRTTIDQINNVE